MGGKCPFQFMFCLFSIRYNNGPTKRYDRPSRQILICALLSWNNKSDELNERRVSMDNMFDCFLNKLKFRKCVCVCWLSRKFGIDT